MPTIAIVISNALQAVEAARHVAALPTTQPSLVAVITHQQNVLIHGAFTRVVKLNPINARALVEAAKFEALKKRINALHAEAMKVRDTVLAPVPEPAPIVAPEPVSTPEPEPEPTPIVAPVAPVAPAPEPVLAIVNDADLDEVPPRVRQQLERVAAQQQRRAARAEAHRRVRPTDGEEDRRHKRTTRRRDMVAAA